jgi:hypothetical protein
MYTHGAFPATHLKLTLTLTLTRALALALTAAEVISFDWWRREYVREYIPPIEKQSSAVGAFLEVRLVYGRA